MIQLIISDLHHKIDKANKIINQVNPDQIICLGDIFDDFNDTPEMVNKTSEWFVNFIENPNNIYIFGNHCLQYAYPDRYFRCSGYQEWKFFTINDIIKRKHWNLAKYYYVLNNTWLLTHAGLHKFNLPDNIKRFYKNRQTFLTKISKYLDKEIIEGLRGKGWIFHAGHARGGSRKVGGITWCDFNKEFYPIKGLNQIFGHTPQIYGTVSLCHLDKNSKIIYKNIKDLNLDSLDFNSVEESYNFNLDVHENLYWMVLNNNKITINNWCDDIT